MTTASDVTTAPAPASGRWVAVCLYGVLPASILLLGLAAGVLKWLDGKYGTVETARTAAVQAATDSTVTMLSYEPETVEGDLASARDRLTASELLASSLLLRVPTSVIVACLSAVSREPMMFRMCRCTASALDAKSKRSSKSFAEVLSVNSE